MSSVVIKSVDVAAVRQAMDRWAARLLAERPEVEEIVVFGSFANGTYAPGSDLDVLIVLSESDLPVWSRVPGFLPGSFPVGIDLFPFTRAELAARTPSPLLDAVGQRSWRYARPAPAGQ